MPNTLDLHITPAAGTQASDRCSCMSGIKQKCCSELIVWLLCSRLSGVRFALSNRRPPALIKKGVCCWSMSAERFGLASSKPQS